MRVALVALALVACAPEQPVWSSGSLVVTPELTESAAIAADWWRAETGARWSLAARCDDADHCVPVSLGSCPPDAWSCVRWSASPFAEEQSIVVAPDALGAGDVALLIAHELGHVMGYEHVDSKPNIMYPLWSGNTWELP